MKKNKNTGATMASWMSGTDKTGDGMDGDKKIIQDSSRKFFLKLRKGEEDQGITTPLTYDVIHDTVPEN